MSLDDAKVWRARAEEMRTLVDVAQGRISKELLLRIAEDYEWFARSIEERPDRFVPSPETVPPEVAQYGERGPSIVPPSESEIDIPQFLKQRPADAE